eukprot:scaffold2310_cov164-Amphora_coffeaeformis.AAC.9
MAMYESVSVSHTTSSSESEGGGEAVEATLRVLSAVRTEEDVFSPSPVVSQSQSQSVQQQSTTSSRQSADKSRISGKSAGSTKSNSLSSIGRHCTSGVAPLQPSCRVTNQAAPLTIKTKGRPVSNYKDSNKGGGAGGGGLFSCCFRGVDQQVVQSHPRASEQEQTQQVVEQVKALSTKSSKKEDFDDVKELKDIKLEKLSPYERAMIERLRELLSLDGTSVPTLPTQIQVQEGRDSPVSLDITDSIIANTFSIDTRDLQQHHNAATDDVEENRSRPDDAFGQHPHNLERVRSASSRALTQVASGTMSGIAKSKPPSVASHEQGLVQGSVHNHPQKLKPNLEQGDASTHRKTIQRTGSTQSQQSGGPEETASANMKRMASYNSKMCNASGLSRKGSAVKGSGSHQSLSTAISRGNNPPKPESTVSPTADDSPMLDLRKSTSLSGSTSVKSKKSFASKVMKSVSRSGSKDSTSSKKPKGSNTSIQQDTDKYQDQVSLKKSRSSSSTTSSKKSQTSNLAGLSHCSSRSTAGSMASRNVANARSKELVQKTSRSSSSSSSSSRLEERERENLEARVLPPRPEVTQKRKDAFETIVATRGKLRDTNENEAVECIYQVEDENEQPEIPVTYSGENLPHGTLKQREMFRRATSAAPRFGKVQNLMYVESREPGVLEERSPAAQNVCKVVSKDPNDIRDDISDLGMLSPKGINAPEKENAGTAVVEPRKVDVFDMFTGGLFCFRPDTTTSV